MPLAFSKGVQHAMDRLMDDCAADATCQRTFPTLRTEFVEVLARLDKAPVLVGVQNLVTNQPQQVTITRAAFVDSLRLMLYVPELTGLLPLIIHHAFESDFAPFAAYAFLLARQIDPQIARGMQLSVICSEHVPFITEADIARETVGTYYGDVRIRSFQDACRQWPSVRALPGFVEPVKSDIPVLMVSGDVDPVTPASIATAAAKFLPNSLHVIIRDGTHLTESPCIRNLISEFISNGSGKDLDTTCVNDIKRPPFIYRFPISFKPAGK
jgi:pimeloyl-ACP methyl ester carboxylesterase